MNRRNWLKSIAALAAGVVGLPLAATGKVITHSFMSGSSIQMDRAPLPGQQWTAAMLKVKNTSGISLYPKRLVRSNTMTKVNQLNHSKTWSG